MTTTSSTFIKDFWNKKIVAWEEARYAAGNAKIVGIKERMEFAGFLAPHVRDKRVIDLGCGTARILNYWSPRSFTGLDISPIALRQARQGFPQQQMETIEGDFQGMDWPSLLSRHDFVFSMGFLDWLPTKTTQEVLNHQTPYLHAFSRTSPKLALLAHKAYCIYKYGGSTYRPAYLADLSFIRAPHHVLVPTCHSIAAFVTNSRQVFEMLQDKQG